MTLAGNAISCDAYGCQSSDDFVGDLSDEDIRLRYHILGWRFEGVDAHERHICPDHA